MLAYARGEAAAFDVLYGAPQGRRLPLPAAPLRQCRHRRGAVPGRVDECDSRPRDVCAHGEVHHLALHARAPPAGRSLALERPGRAGVDRRRRGREHARRCRSAPRRARRRADARANTRELGARIKAALAGLPAAQRDAFLLQQEAGLSLADIATMTGVGAETVKSRLRYAIAEAAPGAPRSARGVDMTDHDPRDPALDAMWRAHSTEAAAGASRSGDPRRSASGGRQRSAFDGIGRRRDASLAMVDAARRGGDDRCDRHRRSPGVPDDALTPTDDERHRPPPRTRTREKPAAPVDRPTAARRADRSVPCSPNPSAARRLQRTPATPAAPAAAAPKPKAVTPPRESAPRAREPSKRENTASAPDPFPARKARPAPREPERRSAGCGARAPAAFRAFAGRGRSGGQRARVETIGRPRARLARRGPARCGREPAARGSAAAGRGFAAARQARDVRRCASAARSGGVDRAHPRAARSRATRTKRRASCAAFRAAYRDADARLPEDLRAWALTIKP